MEYGKLISSCNKIESSELEVETTAPIVFSLELKDPKNIW